MQILACHNRYAVRGGEDIAFDAAVALWRAGGHTVHTVERSNAVLAQGGTAARLAGARRAVFDTDVAAEVAFAARQERPDVAVVQNTFPRLSFAPYEALSALGIPVVQVLYNYRYLCLNGELYTRGAICERCAGGNYWHGVLRRCYRDSFVGSLVAARVARANRRREIWRRDVRLYVVPDRFMAQKLASYGLPAERFRVVPNAVEPRDAPTPLTHDGTLLYVGRWSRAKGVLTLLDAAMSPAMPAITMVGDGPARHLVASHAAIRERRVVLAAPEYGDALWQRLARVAAVVVPSQWYDNLPMVVCQAFVAGRPVIASRINGIPEYVRDGVNGLLVEPGDVEGLRRAMQEIVRDRERWESMAIAARGTAQREFGPDLWVERWNAVFAETRP